MSPLTLVLLAPFLSIDMGTAARDLARSVAAAVAHEPVAISVKNLSTLDAGAMVEIRRVVESELKSSGQPAGEVQFTISENLTQFILAAEIRRGGERQVLLESWPRSTAPAGSAGDKPVRVILEKKLLWEQEQPILDAVETGDGVLVLDQDQVLLARGDARQSAPIAATHARPRDLRGRLSISPAAANAAFTAFLPGAICQGRTGPQFSVECRESADAWLLAPGAIARFVPDRNYFSGHMDIEPGGPQELPPFYSAAWTGEGWIFAALDGRAHIYSRSWDMAGTMERWGSDIAALQTPCGPRILATQAGASGEPDAIQSYVLAGGALNPAGPAVEFTGPITALWTAGNFATAVSHDLQTGRYAAFSLAPTCGS